MKVAQGVFFARVADFGLRFGASVLLARWLGPEDRGVLTFIVLVTAWVVMFGNFSFTEATIYQLGKGTPPGMAAVGLLVFSLGAGVLYLAGAVGLIYGGVLRWPVGEVGIFYLLLALVPLNLAVTNWTAIVQAQQRFTAYNWLLVSRSLAFLVALVIAMQVGTDRLQAVAVAMVATAVLNFVILGCYLGRLLQWKGAWSPAFLKAVFRYGIRSHLSVILANITLRFDQFVLGTILTPAHLGWYATAASLSELPQLLPDSIAVVLLPRVSRDPVSGAALTARACRCTIVCMLVVVLGLALAAPVAIPLIYGQAFAPAVRALLYLLPGVIFLSMSKILTKYLCGIGKPGLCVWSTATSAGATAVLIIPLVHQYGMVGAGITSSCAYAAGAVVDLIFTVRHSPHRVSDFLVPRREDFRRAVWF